MAGRVGVEPTSVLGSKPSYPCQQSNRPMKEVITTRIPPVCCRGYSSTTIPCAALTHQPKPCPCDFQCSPRDSNSQHYGSEPQASTVGLEEQVTWSGLIRSRPRILRLICSRFARGSWGGVPYSPKKLREPRGGCEIRTHEGVTPTRLAVERNRPLCESSIVPPARFELASLCLEGSNSVH